MIQPNRIQIIAAFLVLVAIVLPSCDKKDTIDESVIELLRGSWYSNPDSVTYSEIYFFGRPGNSSFFQMYDLDKRFGPEMIITHISKNEMQFKKTQAVDTAIFNLSFLTLSKDSIVLKEKDDKHVFYKLSEYIKLPENDLEYEAFENDFIARWRKLTMRLPL